MVGYFSWVKWLGKIVQGYHQGYKFSAKSTYCCWFEQWIGRQDRRGDSTCQLNLSQEGQELTKGSMSPLVVLVGTSLITKIVSLETHGDSVLCSMKEDGPLYKKMKVNS